MKKYTLKTASLVFAIFYFFAGVVAPVFAQVAYTYDANGNMTSDGQNCYTYNDANQLSQVKNCSSNQVVAQYVYDYNGQRIEKKIYSSGSLQKTVYSPDKNFETAKLASNSATSNTSYYYVNDEVAAQKNPDGSKTYHLSDNLGSTSVLTNQSGSTVENTSYYPFGQIRSGGTQSKYLYTGQENDSETALDYYNARYYNPGNMHFTQPDTMLPNVYDPQQLNRYAYVRNNPLTVTDPTGHILGIDDLIEAVVFAPIVIAVATHPDEAEAAIYAGISLVQAGSDALNHDLAAAGGDLLNGAVSFMSTRVKAPSENKTPSNTNNMSQEEINQASQQIGQGHSYEKHGSDFEPLGVNSQDDFISHINGVMTNPSAAKNLSNSRSAFLDNDTGTVVIYDPVTGAKNGQYGTAFIPQINGVVNSLNYYNNLR